MGRTVLRTPLLTARDLKQKKKKQRTVLRTPLLTARMAKQKKKKQRTPLLTAPLAKQKKEKAAYGVAYVPTGCYDGQTKKNKQHTVLCMPLLTAWMAKQKRKSRVRCCVRPY